MFGRRSQRDFEDEIQSHLQLEIDRLQQEVTTAQERFDVLRQHGTLRVVRPGVGEFDVKEASLRDFKVPAGMIPRLVGRVARNRPDGVAPSGIPLRIPQHVGDVRVANGRVTLYRANQ